MEKQSLRIVLIAVFLMFGFYLITMDTASSETRLVTVTGSAEHLEKPDLANIYLTIETRADNAENASSLNSELTQSVKDALYNYGLGEDDLETTSYYVNPVRKWENGTYYTVGYETRHSLKVTCEDISSVGSIIDLAIESGANRVDSVSFDLSEERREELRMITLGEASENARVKAEILAESLDTKVRRVHKISEVSSGYVPLYRQDILTESGSSPGTQITPGVIKTSVSVVVEFELS